jgi:hypothetical protein
MSTRIRAFVISKSWLKSPGASTVAEAGFAASGRAAPGAQHIEALADEPEFQYQWESPR